MATAPLVSSSAQPGAALDDSPVRARRRSTSHLKLVPETREQRELLRLRCRQVTSRLDKSRPLTKDEMEQLARATLAELNLAEGYVGWMMVTLASEFWRESVASIPPARRLFLLPHCLKHAEGCPADYDQFGLDCKKCGACSIADFRAAAENLGYKVLVAEGSPIVLKIIVSGYVDAIVGVACLNVLEKAIDKILLAGIPCMAVPLLSSDCRNTSVDEDWVHDLITNQPVSLAPPPPRSYVHLLRVASQMFQPAELERLAPRARGSYRPGGTLQGQAPINPLAATEALAYDFLAKGGKYARPFITLAVYDALSGAQGTQAGGDQYLAQLAPAVKRAALAIEVFHKASLVHDDIEDDDGFRYGEATLHRQHGIPLAINVGDYLIGLGYRLVSRDTATLGAETAAQILDGLADAHTRLSEGQGAELAWRDASNKRLQPLEALKIYALKTAPAFEAALLTGARLAGSCQEYVEPLKAFARHLGVAFQILNDLHDWQGDSHNKLLAGGDVLGGRPTLLWALALEALGERERTELEQLAAGQTHLAPAELVSRVRALYEQADVFEKAHQLVDKYQQKAEAVADAIEPEELRRLLYYLVDTVLERPAAVEPEASAPAPLVRLNMPAP